MFLEGSQNHLPGLVTEEQVAGWTRITDAVYTTGGRIVAQLMLANDA